MINNIKPLIGHQARWAEFSKISPAESLIIRSITFTFAFYLLGALYLVAPILGWSLLAGLIIRWVLNWASNGTVYNSLIDSLSIGAQVNTSTGASGREKQNTRWLIIVWIIGACVLELVLIIGHVDFDLGFGKIIKSSIGWAKGWALLSIFIVLGFSLNIRYQIICRAACVVGLLALLIAPVLVFAYAASLPGHLYVSPLKVLGGAGDEFFTVILYEIDPFNGAPRWRFFAPWAPAVGLVANIYFMCAWFEKNRKWRVIGLLGNALMIVMAVSRMGMIVLLLAPIAVWGLSRLTRPWVMIVASVFLLVLVVLFEPISANLLALFDEVKGARADSTRVRAALGNIALYRWQSEAYWFGHGVVERGTHLVEFMPIGSHHNWYGLLFVKGMIGNLAFAIPFGLTICVLLVKAQYQVSSRLGLGMCVIVGFFSLSENVEALAYMTWPAWLCIGAGLRSKITDIDTNDMNLMAQFRLLSEQQVASAAMPKLTA